MCKSVYVFFIHFHFLLNKSYHVSELKYWNRCHRKTNKDSELIEPILQKYVIFICELENHVTLFIKQIKRYFLLEIPHFFFYALLYGFSYF